VASTPPVTRRFRRGPVHKAEGARNGHGNQPSVLHRSQGHKLNADGEGVSKVVRNFNSEAGLADAVGSSQRQQADVIATQERHSQSRLVLSSDQCRQGRRQHRSPLFVL
jgi:hypothetical protein